MSETLDDKIQRSPFKNIYWFARYLLDTDQYGAMGKNNDKKLLNTVSFIETIITQNSLTENEKYNISKKALTDEINAMNKVDSKAHNLALNLIDRLDREIQTLDDVVIFCITMQYVVSPINNALKLVPSNDKEFCENKAKRILDELGEKRVGLLISTWDELGVKSCLNRERAVVIDEFFKLIDNIERLEIEHNELDDNLMLTAFIQEFERRLAQKRKSRGGSSLEDVDDFIFNYYGFPSSDKPKHFDQDLEIDKWFKCKDGWYIGISCKRTVRERWKQVSQADENVLSHFKIREIWHLITYDKDITDDKIVRLGAQRQVFYLLDDSPLYQRCKNHPGMKDYVRPLSHFVDDIRNLI